MKRARVTTRSEAARARARVPPASPDALLDDADAIVGQLFAGADAVAALAQRMRTRKDDSVQLALSDCSAAHAVLADAARRGCSSAKRCALRLVTKSADAAVETLAATATQLRVWGSPAVLAQCALDDIVVSVGCALASLLPSMRAPVVRAGGLDLAAVLCSAVGAVMTGDGLRVVGASGPGLQWFEPHSRNELSVVLAQADGSVPVWLRTDDVTVTVLLPAGIAPCGSGRPSVTVTDGGAVSLAYGGLHEDTPEAVLLLAVCGAAVCGATGDGEWRARVLRKLATAHSCEALGRYIGTAVTLEDFMTAGMAVSADEKWLVCGLMLVGMIQVYSLPGGELVRTISLDRDFPDETIAFGRGFVRVCFAPNGHLLVYEQGCTRLQEVTLEGVHVRFIGEGCLNGREPFGVAVHNDVIALGCVDATGPHVALLDFGSGVVKSRFGKVTRHCIALAFTPDGSHVVVPDHRAACVSIFTLAGVCVRCVGGQLGKLGVAGVLLTAMGEFVVADRGNWRVCVFSPDGSELVRSWGGVGTGDGQFAHKMFLVVAGRHLYVMDHTRVQLFE